MRVTYETAVQRDAAWSPTFCRVSWCSWAAAGAMHRECWCLSEQCVMQEELGWLAEGQLAASTVCDVGGASRVAERAREHIMAAECSIVEALGEADLGQQDVGWV
jgi:hypothetical protein